MKALHRPVSTFLILASCCTFASAAGVSSTVADWRFEEGPNGAVLPAGDDTVQDSSGNGNQMRTWDPTFTSPSYSTMVSPLALRSGAANNFSLDFGPGGDDPGLNDDIYTTPAKPISGKLFNAMTVEFAFNMDTIGGFQSLFGKDGKPLSNSAVPPLKIMVRGDSYPNNIPNQLFVEWLDGNGVDRQLSSHYTVTAGSWNHLALVIGPTNAELYVAGVNTPYTLLDSLSGSFAAPTGEVMIAEPLGFSVGRGYWNNNPADWADAHIDEVKVSDATLAPDQFEFLTVPEPASLSLLTAACAAALIRRRRR